MTETEWLTSENTTEMLQFLHGRASWRKLRLLAVACCRFVWKRFTDWRCRRAIEVAEQFADGLALETELAKARVTVKANRDGILGRVAKQVAGTSGMSAARGA